MVYYDGWKIIIVDKYSDEIGAEVWGGQEAQPRRWCGGLCPTG